MGGMKRSPLVRRTELKRTEMKRTRTALPRVIHIRGRSRKLQAEMAAYVPEMLAFLAVHDRCEFPAGCNERSQIVHHRKGRNGRRLRDQRFWSAACDPHNEFAETHTGEALEIGWLVRINSRGDAA